MPRTKEEQAKLANRAQLWSDARQAIEAYLLEYGVQPVRAQGAASDILDDELSNIINEEGEGW